MPIINCPNCGVPARTENIHACKECGAHTCAYCETAHYADNHPVAPLMEESTNAEVPVSTESDNRGPV